MGMLVAVATAGEPTSGPAVIWLEAEHFQNAGGWTHDAQFIDQMGSPYLLAVGLGEPVADAVTKVVAPKPGTYRLWVRSRDWIPEHHPGQFQVIIGGNTSERTFGRSGKAGWHWEDGGTHDIGVETELRLHDLTGYYARCDALVLTADVNWVPPEEKGAIQTLRLGNGGVAAEIVDKEGYDVVVAGGGLAGCLAAVSSARLGARTALIQNRPVLGGNASVEILVPPVGVWPHAKMDPLDPRETGLIEDIRTEGNQRPDEAKLYSGRLARFVGAEPGLDVYLNTHIIDVEMKTPTEIASVVALDVRSGKRARYPAKIFVDCTGESSVGVAAGAEYRHGREPRSMYNESLAVEQADQKTMGNTLKYESVPTDDEQPFLAPPWARSFPNCDTFPPRRHPVLGREVGWQWMIELGGTRDTYADAEEIRDDLLRLIYGQWDHVKNYCPNISERAAVHKLAWVGHVAGKRENRRLIGDYVLNENDIRDQTLFPDRIAYGGWGIDDHYPEGFFHDGPPASHGLHGIIHSIPYRSLYSKNIDNLLMAGRNISASHVAMAATRVMLTCGIVGHAAGAAAALCVRHDESPRGIYRGHIAELQQQLLKDGAYLVRLANADPRDLARGAKTFASSERSSGPAEIMSASNVIDGYARKEDDRTHAWAPAAESPLPQWVELRWDTPQLFNMVHVAFQTKLHSPSAFEVQVNEGGGWRTVAGVEGNRQRHHMLGFGEVKAGAMRVVLLKKNGHQEPGVCEVRVYHEPQRVLEIAARAMRTRDLPDPKPALGWDDTIVEFSGVNPKKMPGIVVDDTEAETSGRWVHSTYALPYVGNGFIHDANADKGEKWVKFRSTIPVSRRYEVRIAYLAVGNRASRVPVIVRSADGEKTVLINERVKPPIDGLWQSLGVFRFEAGSTGEVIVRNDATEGYVSADAAQWIPAD